MNVDVHKLRAAGESMRCAGFADVSLAAALGLHDLAHLRSADLPVYERRLAGNGQLDMLVPFFLFGKPVERQRLDETLGGAGLGALADAGLIHYEGDQAIPDVRFTLFRDMVFAHDPESGAGLAEDHVTGIGPAPKTLHAMTIREPVRRALDIGTGCGVQALFLARHADHVIGTDVNSRALWLAECNAALNGIDNVEWREGSLFEPVAGETFDLVVANPPFVQSPDRTYIFRDGGTAENICERLIADVPDHLVSGGYAQSLISWAVGKEGDWGAVPRGWIEGAGCDAWLLHYETEDGLAYAAKWNAWSRENDPKGYAAALDRWTAHYEVKGIASLATGAITLRKREDGAPWWLASHMTDGPASEAGRQVRRVFDARDGLLAMGDTALLACVPRFCGDHRLDQQMRFRDGAYAVEATQIVLDDGVGVPSPIPADALLVVLTIDGETPLSTLVAEAGDGLGADEMEALTTSAVRTVRELAKLGVIEPQA